MSIVPSSWMPNCSVRRIILHWTAGSHQASDIDLAHYHILIEGDGKLVKGTHSIKDNVSTADNNYAAHTYKLNTGSIGVSVCCMENAKESPFNGGTYPMTQVQWKTMAQVAAELCQFYRIPVTSTTVLGYGEVEKTYGIDQAGKWDPMVLPWDLSLDKTEVGNRFRAEVKSRISGDSDLLETPASITSIVKGKTFREAQIFNEKSVIKLRPLLEEFNWTLLHANATVVELSGFDNNPQSIPYKLIDIDNTILAVPAGSSEAEIVKLVRKFGFIAARDLAKMLDLPIA